ncbi:acyl carrier protein [Kitasatospora sp. A2-31]|uniref:acyl carrier protein n=1 Tax=Kitasatospora sp. A2-31 TaxID=2916414 RepID=UPI001EECB79D|nr:acyl carrier protein [Kitasatospora sp. A2-31]MCG6497873.1 acyl carrier protein [Kitasatospora sp. A2-31]
MTSPALPDRADVRTILAAFGQRAAEDVPEELGSLELTWLIAEFEQRYGVQLDLDDEQFEAVRTVDTATEVLRAAVLAAGATAAAAAATPGAAQP